MYLKDKITHFKPFFNLRYGKNKKPAHFGYKEEAILTIKLQYLLVRCVELSWSCNFGYFVTVPLFFCIAQFFLSIVVVPYRFHNHYTQKDYNSSMKATEVTPPSLFKPLWFSRQLLILYGILTLCGCPPLRESKTYKSYLALKT